MLVSKSTDRQWTLVGGDGDLWNFTFRVLLIRRRWRAGKFMEDDDDEERRNVVIETKSDISRGGSGGKEKNWNMIT